MGSRSTIILVLGLLGLPTIIFYYFLTLHDFNQVMEVPRSIRSLSDYHSESVVVVGEASKIGHEVKVKRTILESNLPTKRSMTERGNSLLLDDMKRCSLAMGMLEEELNELENVAKKAQLFLDTLRLVFPRKFSQEFKNPCWYPNNVTLIPYTRRTLQNKTHPAKQLNQSQEEQLLGIFKSRILNPEFNNGSQKHQLLCLPYFFLAGFPKSGTTSLHYALHRHPQIVPPAVKEPHWWTRIPPYRVMDPDYLKLAAIRYSLFFKSMARENVYIGTSGLSQRQTSRITYDGTQSLLWGSSFFSEINYLDYCAMPAIMSRILPEAKFIVLMRNPTTREYSNFFYMCQWDKLNKISQGDPPTQFHHAATIAIDRLHKCQVTGSHSLQWCLGDLNSLQRGCGYIGRRLNIGMYYVHLLKWMQFYSRENFLFLQTEDMRKDPSQMMAQITGFLGVDRINDQYSKQWLSIEANVQEDYRKRFKMKPETEELLNDFYKPYNKLLVNMTGSGRFLWT